MMLHQLHPDAKFFSQEVTDKIIRCGQKRLVKSGIQEFCEQHNQSEDSSSSIEWSHHTDFVVDQWLGEGSFSCVYGARRIQEPTQPEQEQQQEEEQLVIKVLRPQLMEKPGLFARCAADLVREGMLLSILKHQNILSCKALGTSAMLAYGNGQHDAFFLVLERLQITLKDKMEEWKEQAKKSSLRQAFSRKQSRMEKTLLERIKVMCSLAEALRYLHSQRIMHRDLKPDNLGLTSDGCLKVFDFDVCRLLPEEAKQNPNATFHLTRRTGSPRYMAPEIEQGENYNAKADVYSFGLLAYELLSLKKVYEGISIEELRVNVLRNGDRPQCPKQWPSEVKDFIRNCWDADLHNRPTMQCVTQNLPITLSLLCPSSMEDWESILEGPKDRAPAGRSSSATHRIDGSDWSQ